MRAERALTDAAFEILEREPNGGLIVGTARYNPKVGSNLVHFRQGVTHAPAVRGQLGLRQLTRGLRSPNTDRVSTDHFGGLRNGVTPR